MTTEPKFPPRVWIPTNDLDAWSKASPKETEFISIEEHLAIVREERAKAFEHCRDVLESEEIYEHAEYFEIQAAKSRRGEGRNDSPNKH